MGKFIITRRTNGELQFNLRAENNEIILTSEGYSTVASCLKGIESVRENAADDASYDRRTSSNNKRYFNLKAGNHQVIGTSELYESTSAMEVGIASVKRNAPIASLEYFEAVALPR